MSDIWINPTVLKICKSRQIEFLKKCSFSPANAGTAVTTPRAPIPATPTAHVPS